MAAQKHSRVVKFALSRCSLVIFVLHKVNIIPWYIYKQLGSIKTKQGLTHSPVYYPILHQHTWAIHNSYMSQMCIQIIANIFAGFWIPTCWVFALNSQKFMYREYYHVYSNCSLAVYNHVHQFPQSINTLESHSQLLFSYRLERCSEDSIEYMYWRILKSFLKERNHNLEAKEKKLKIVRCCTLFVFYIVTWNKSKCSLAYKND